MKFLVIGLGSMGKRRIRNLLSLGYTAEEIAGFDPREDRREEASSKYVISTYQTVEGAFEGFKPEALVISTSPESHMKYAFMALEMGLPSFIEASVTDKEKILELSKVAKDKKQVFAPSCTMKYFAGPILIRKLLNEGKIGKTLFFNYQTGQHLEEWHPWEEIGDYYVSKRETSGAREIVPFELTWLNSLFGDPKILSGYKSKKSDMPFDFDDFYHFSMQYQDGTFGGVFVDVLTRKKACRRLHIVGSQGQIIFDGDQNVVKYVTANDDNWITIDLAEGSKEKGYINPEEPYISEMSDFCNAVKNSNQSLFPNTLEEDYKILDLLNHIEEQTQ